MMKFSRQLSVQSVDGQRLPGFGQNTMRTRKYITVQYVGNLGTIEDYVLISLLSMGELKGHEIS
jgi:hypothetical protein